MTVCPFCMASNEPGVQRCRSCGRDLVTMRCPHCSAANSAQDAYCVVCQKLLHPTYEAEKLLSDTPALISDSLPEGINQSPIAAPADSPTPPDNATYAPEAASGNQESDADFVARDSTPWEKLVPAPDDDVESIDGVLKVNPRMLEQPEPTSPAIRRETTRESELARLWQQIGTKHAPLDEGRHSLGQRPGNDTSRRQRLLIYILTLVLALLPFVTRGQITEAMTVTRSPLYPLAAELATVPADRPMLISFDYNASYAGELAPAAEAILSNLVGRQVPLLTMTTRATAADMAAVALSHVQSGRDTLLWSDLGYTPGQTGLRLMAESWQAAFPLCSDPAGTQNAGQVSRVLVFSDSLETSLAWIELFGSQVDLPIQMIVTERIYPLLLPYEDSGQLDLLVSGATAAPAATNAPQTDLRILLYVGVLGLAIWTTFRQVPRHTIDGK